MASSTGPTADTVATGSDEGYEAVASLLPSTLNVEIPDKTSKAIALMPNDAADKEQSTYKPPFVKVLLSLQTVK